MIFTPNKLSLGNGIFRIPQKAIAEANFCLISPIMQELWKGFNFTFSELEMTASSKPIFRIGEAEPLTTDGNMYAINVTEKGICITSESDDGLKKGFMTLLDLIECDDNGAYISECVIKESPLVKNCMAHFCVFHNTELWEIQKFFRLCGVLKYSHIVLEFWGMIKYDVKKELSWSSAFTKDEIRPLIKEANDMGLEIIPMFNHWGHAAACRVMHGKHVILDQAPWMQSYFSDDGWCWNIKKPKVRALLSGIRSELIELCGEGSYFHIGCDEAYNFEFTKENVDNICDFLNETASELSNIGRRPIMWGDMLIYYRPEFNPKNHYYAFCPNIDTEEYITSKLDRRIVIADWQYECDAFPVESAQIFKKYGFDTLLCPWDMSDARNKTCTDTVKSEKLFGLMHTTWHTLSAGTPYVAMAALACWENEARWTGASLSAKTASLMRKAYFTNGDYTTSGWARYEINVKT